MRKTVFTLLAAATAMSAVPASAVVTIYTDESAFQAALASVTVEDFNDNTFALGIASDAGARQGNHFEDRLVRGGDNTTFSFSGAVNGLGGFFNLSPGGAGQGIEFLLDGTTLLGTEVPNGNGNSFWGFITDTSFTSVILNGGTQGGVAETYHLDDLQFGALAAAGGVPEPATWAMMIIGFGAIGASMRRKKAQVSYSMA